MWIARMVIAGAAVALGPMAQAAPSAAPGTVRPSANRPPLMHEEPFGPIALIAPFATLDKAIDRANGLPYGLAAFAFTKSLDRAAALVDRLESGSLCINHVNGAALPELPLGGVKASGYGHEGGAESLDAYMTKMVVSEAIGAAI